MFVIFVFLYKIEIVLCISMLLYWIGIKYLIFRSNFGVSIFVKNLDFVVCVCFVLVNLLLWLLCWLVLINICSIFYFVESLENRIEKKIDVLRIKYFKN